MRPVTPLCTRAEEVIDLHLLRVFVEVSRTGTVAGAATALALTPSPVSRSLRELERLAGPLFERAYHDMRRLPRAEELLPDAVGVLQLAADLADRVAGRSTTLRFAATPWVPGTHLDAFVDAASTSSLPAVESDNAVSSEIIDQLRHGRIDLALVHLPIDVPGLCSRSLGTYRFQLVVGVDDPVSLSAADEGVDVSVLAGRTVLLPPLPVQPIPLGRLRRWLEQAGGATVESMDLTQMAGSLSTRLRRTGACAITVDGHDLPISLRPDRFRSLRLLGDQPVFQLGLAWRRVNPRRESAISTIADGLVSKLLPSGDTPRGAAQAGTH